LEKKDRLQIAGSAIRAKDRLKGRIKLEGRGEETPLLSSNVSAQEK
jgi:hypothetical protein